MDQELPPHLEATRKLLAASLPHPISEAAPAIPGELFGDLSRRFNSTVAKPDPARPWFAAIQSFLARPAFGMAALAVVILAVAVPALLDSKSGAGKFRGSASGPVDSKSIRILLVKAPASTLGLLEKSGSFENGAISNFTGAPVTGARVVVDFEKSTIAALDASGAEVHSAPIPAESADLPAAVATAVSRL